MKISDVYSKALQVLPKDCIDNHESDLYLKDTKETRELIAEIKESYACAEYLIDRFHSDIDNCYWFDIPFAYFPFWESIREEQI